MSSKKVVNFFYDVISPYSWLGFESITRHAQLWEPKGVKVLLRPFLLKTIMKESGNKPPGLIPAKGMYMITDLRRLNSFFKVPLTIPENFMDYIRRVDDHEKQMMFITAVDYVTKGSGTEAVTREFYKAIFKDHFEVGKLPFDELAKKAGLSEDVIAQVNKSTSSQEVKDKLSNNSQEALQAGAFGAPTMIVDAGNGEKSLFFGCDRIELVAHTLGVEYGGSLTQLSKL